MAEATRKRREMVVVLAALAASLAVEAIDVTGEKKAKRKRRWVIYYIIYNIH